MMQIFKVG